MTVVELILTLLATEGGQLALKHLLADRGITDVHLREEIVKLLAAPLPPPGAPRP